MVIVGRFAIRHRNRTSDEIGWHKSHAECHLSAEPGDDASKAFPHHFRNMVGLLPTWLDKAKVF